METCLLDWSYMKNTTCAWYLRGENTISFNCRMLLQTCKIAGEGKQMSCFKWWRMNWQTPIAEDRTNIKIWTFPSLFSTFFLVWGRCKHLTSRRNTITGSYMCVSWLLHLFMDSFLSPILRLPISLCDTEMLSSPAEQQLSAEVKRKIRNCWSS